MRETTVTLTSDFLNNPIVYNWHKIINKAGKRLVKEVKNIHWKCFVLKVEHTKLGTYIHLPIYVTITIKLNMTFNHQTGFLVKR